MPWNKRKKARVFLPEGQSNQVHDFTISQHSKVIFLQHQTL